MAHAGRQLSEFLSADYLCAKGELTEVLVELTEVAAELSEVSLPKHYHRNRENYRPN